ncbi:MAG: hypothetical protein IPH28_25250 [Cytophagaceae bacterium]|nr:hypothetical protein [Cytophagaceae bacterium]
MTLCLDLQPKTTIKGIVAWGRFAIGESQRTIAGIQEKPVIKGFRHVLWPKRRLYYYYPAFISG